MPLLAGVYLEPLNQLTKLSSYKSSNQAVLRMFFFNQHFYFTKIYKVYFFNYISFSLKMRPFVQNDQLTNEMSWHCSSHSSSCITFTVNLESAILCCH